MDLVRVIDGERRDDGSLEADHRIDPLANPGILFEESRVNKVHAAGPCHLAVNDDNLAMHPQVRAADEGPEQSDRQGGPHLNPCVSKSLRLPSLPPRARAECIDEQSAGDASFGGTDDGLENLVRCAAFIPDVKLSINTLDFAALTSAMMALSISGVLENS